MQRVMLFTEDLALATIAQQVDILYVLLGAIVVVIVWLLDLQLHMQSAL
jgi:hypothetical protein